MDHTKITPRECPGRNCPAMEDDGPGVWVNGSTTRAVPPGIAARVAPGTEQPVWIERDELLRLIGEHFTPDELQAAAQGRALVG